MGHIHRQTRLIGSLNHGLELRWGHVAKHLLHSRSERHCGLNKEIRSEIVEVTGSSSVEE